MFHDKWERFVLDAKKEYDQYIKHRDLLNKGMKKLI